MENDTEESRAKDVSTTTTADIAGAHLFTDVSKAAFPAEWYMWNHVGFPRRYAGTPVFPDFNGDGVPDFFYHNHYRSSPEFDWDLGISFGNNTIASGRAFWASSGQDVFESTEREGIEQTFIPPDTHGTAILDIDRDGMLDMYISTGGGMGMASGPQKNAMMFWGEKANNTLQQKLRGGRDVAAACDVHNEDSRGRFTYFADFDDDGLLDLVFSNAVRVDGANKFGYAMMNKGARRFEKHQELQEYISTMVLTDADGDGHARELVIQRARCLPMEGTGGVPAANPSRKRLQFCEKRPEGSTVVYSYNSTSRKFEQMSREFTRSTRGDRPAARSMQTGDFDGDLKADLLVLFPFSISFYLSGSRSAGKLPVGRPTFNLTWNESDCNARALRVADFDMDGREELLVMCARHGTHMLYERHDGAWLRKQGTFGDLSSKELPRVDSKLLLSACTIGDVPGYLQEHCQAVGRGRKSPGMSTYGISVVDFDNDGFPDVTLTHDVGSLMLLRNDWSSSGGAAGNRFLRVRLIGNETNQYGVGATVVLLASNMGLGQNTTASLFREMYSASHDTDWWGGRDNHITFGLGKAGIPRRLTVRWPGKTRKTQVVEDAEWMSYFVNHAAKPMTLTEPGAS
eukprot:TRINITY_DN4833_c0_g2_i1.p1 TRINITY_DN4833_c0_g2~~TRINITY_DN4833_c0_g2_i1.p1  ORF type:complete len:692 (-),score=80.15 TRINITY_DN4833_c0_g2_i1:601-2484(-)